MGFSGLVQACILKARYLHQVCHSIKNILRIHVLRIGNEFIRILPDTINTQVANSIPGNMLFLATRVDSYQVLSSLKSEMCKRFQPNLLGNFTKKAAILVCILVYFKRI